jgi:hypothetical protein
VLQLFLDRYGSVAPGVDLSAAEQELLQLLTDSQSIQTPAQVLGEMKERAADVHHLLTYMIDAPITYCAASYWSPIDGRRHTLTRRADLPAHERDKGLRTVLAYAYAFYALTHRGSELRSHYSISQYIIDVADAKRPVNVSYAEKSKDLGAEWIHLPGSLRETVFKETGLAQAIQDVFLDDNRYSEEDLHRHLGLALANTEDNPWSDLAHFADDYIRAFDKQGGRVSPKVREVVDKVMARLNERLEPKKPIDFPLALFMVLTHYMYCKACPAEFIHMAVIPMWGSHCTMTVGTARKLKDQEQLSLRAVCRSMFLNPLLLDLAALVQQLALVESQGKTIGLVHHEIERGHATIKNILACEKSSPGIKSAEKGLDRVGMIVEASYALTSGLPRKLAKRDFVAYVKEDVATLLNRRAVLAPKVTAQFDNGLSDVDLRLYIIAREILRNAAKHVTDYPELRPLDEIQGIVFDISTHGSGVCLLCRSSHHDLPIANPMIVFREKPLAHRKMKGLGLVRLLAEQLGGSCKWEPVRDGDHELVVDDEAVGRYAVTFTYTGPHRMT